MTTSTPIPSPRQTTPPTVEQVKACRYWWVYNSAADTNPDVRQMLVRDDEVQVQCGDEWEWIDVAFHEIAALLFAPCLPPGVEDAEIKRLRAVESYAIHVGRCLRGCFFRDEKLNPAPDCKTGSDFAAIGAA